MRRGSARSWTRCVRGAATRHDVTTGGPPPSTSVSPFRDNARPPIGGQIFRDSRSPGIAQVFHAGGGWDRPRNVSQPWDPPPAGGHEDNCSGTPSPDRCGHPDCTGEQRHEQLAGRQADPFHHAFRVPEEFGTGRPVAQMPVLRSRAVPSGAGKTLDVCPKCDHHMRINARTRLDIFLDEDGREELGADLEPVDRLKFRDSKKYRIASPRHRRTLARRTR